MDGSGTLKPAVESLISLAPPMPASPATGRQPRRANGNRNKNVAFFAQDISDGSTIKRVHQLIARGFTVTVFGFRRDRYNIDFKPPWPHVLLGYTHDRRYLQRLRSLLAAIPTFWAERAQLAHSSVFYARNLDQLVLALIVRLFANRRATIVYEVLDIQPILTSKGPIALLLRSIERLCLRGVRYLALSSPGFYRHYYYPLQRYRGAWLLVENKFPGPIPASRPAPGSDWRHKAPTTAGQRPWVIGYFGLIRGQRTVDLIARLAKRLGWRVEFRFRGVLTTVERERFEATLAAAPNIGFHGPFDNPDDLAELYGSVDFAWALDLENVEHNSRWLMPCRLYEAGYFGVPCLAVRGFELGNHVERQRIGWTFDDPFEDSLARFFVTLTPEEYAEKRERLLAAPLSAFVAGADIDALARVMANPNWAFEQSAAEARSDSATA